jgi:hypothetical protein
MFLRTNEKMKRYNYLPQIMKIKCTINKQEFLIGLIIEAAAISGISAIFLPSAAIRSCANRNVLASLLLQPDEECHLLYSSRPQNVESWAIPSWRITINYRYHHSVQLLSYSLHLSYAVNNR